MKRTLHETPYRLKLFVEGQGSPVFVIHGQLSTHDNLRDVIKELAKHHTVYCVDLLGYGDSPRPKRAAYTVAQHVASLYRTIEDAEIKTPFILLGHSMGAQLALAFTTAHPQMVSRLILTALPLFDSPATAYAQMGATDPRIAWILWGKRIRFLRSLPRFSEKPLGWLANRINKGVYPEYLSRAAARIRWPAYHRSMTNVVIGYTPFQDIKVITVPTHFIFGKHDTLAPDAEQKLQKYLSDKRTIEVVEAGHHLPQEQVDLIVQRVLEV